MPRRCPACQTVIDDDRLVACPNPQCPSHFSGPAQVLSLTNDQVDRLVTAVVDSLSKSGATLDKLTKPVAWRIFKNFHWWIAMPLFYLGFLGVSVYSIKSHLENLTITRISQQFAEPRIRETFQEVAENQASKMLRDEIQPAVDRFRDETTEQVQSFQVFLDNLKADLQKEHQTLSEEVSRLKTRNNLTTFGDKAISQGDRDALDQLFSIEQNESNNSTLKAAVGAEIRRVISFWTFMSSTSQTSITVTLPNGTTKKDQNMSTTELIGAISNEDWEIRAASARLLGQRKEKGVPEVLLRIARTDKHLEVVKFAVESFRAITGSPIWGLFNINEIEYWWQAHHAEVNEKLAPI